MPQTPQMYSVKVADRIKELVPDAELTSYASFSYSFNHGYEKYTFKPIEGGGSIEYAGSFHPEVYCDNGYEDKSQPGVCIWCGKTMF